MTAFEQGWALLKEFRFNNKGWEYAQEGGYDPEKDEAYANLSSHASGYREKPISWDHPDYDPYAPTRWPPFRSDQELVDIIIRNLSHEMAHQGLHPPHLNDLWNAVSVKNLPDDISDEERARIQAKVGRDWVNFQEYGAWAATPGIDDEERKKRMDLYGLPWHRREDI